MHVHVHVAIRYSFTNSLFNATPYPWYSTGYIVYLSNRPIFLWVYRHNKPMKHVQIAWKKLENPWMGCYFCSMQFLSSNLILLHVYNIHLSLSIQKQQHSTNCYTNINCDSYKTWIMCTFWKISLSAKSLPTLSSDMLTKCWSIYMLTNTESPCYSNW